MRAALAIAVLATATGIGSHSELQAQDTPDREERPQARDPRDRARARDLGIVPGSLAPGSLNAITDVAGVLVGHVTVREEDDVRSGVTVILAHGGDLFRERVPAALHVGNGFGKLVGVTQLRELGELETPIALTCTLCVWNVANGVADWTLSRTGHEDVRSVNPVVGETNDGLLNDIRSRPVTERHVAQALERASGGPVEEGAVGAGTGTIAFGWKAGIGTSSRLVPVDDRAWTVGVLVQSNFGGDLTILGVPVGRELARRGVEPLAARPLRRPRDSASAVPRSQAIAGDGSAVELTGEWEAGRGDGSIVAIVATDAPLDARQLERLASRAMLGVARTGSVMSHGSGDYAIAFSTAEGVRRPTGVAPAADARRRVHEDGAPAEGRPVAATLPEATLTPFFQAVVEATEEAIYNSLFKAVTTTGSGHTVEALPIETTLEILRARGAGQP